jgi:hypothetical protein
MAEMWKRCAGLLLLLATACERPETVDIGGHMVSVQRLGVHDIVYADFGDRAVLGALHRTVQAGVPKDKIEKVTLSTFHGRRDRGRPSFDLWVRIAGCNKQVYMGANLHGRVVTVQDKGGCLNLAAGTSPQ